MAKESGGPENAVESFVCRHENSLYRTALAILGSKAEAEDVVQEVFLKYIEKGPSFQSPEHEKAWLIRVAINLCKNRLRSSWWRKTVPLLESYPADPEGRQDGVVEAVMALPPKYRTVIHLFYYEDYSTAQISALTGQKESTVRSLLTRARQKIKVLLKGEEP
ncbi:MAG TPA: RNA polymerase sigma factor [Bacillota bacterium]|jgi:RNA polymerase sigma-70 factor (ECF subfamily)|nr:RNA polymerase sigma factor [Bacillota bacterium]HOB87186.1 RNA polymerase sigma factor [Bacillota bacterium]HOP68372.1 RNA polymerase sigma factor [Bacillota bacterium]HPT33459.1 RNA polymerase sigma factor [Bacillota bacterium]HPZ64789.1 RNA polymerase sigma factor [Bacillota bacterium]